MIPADSVFSLSAMEPWLPFKKNGCVAGLICVSFDHPQPKGAERWSV